MSGGSVCDAVMLRTDCSVIAHPGWDRVLRSAQALGVESVRGLVQLSVGIALLLFLVPPLFLVRRHEAWLAVVGVLSLAEPAEYWRIALGRPYSVAIGVLVALGWLWRPLAEQRTPWQRLSLLSLLFAWVTWTHGNVYLWALPLACFAVATGPRVAIRLGGALATGVILGSVLTGHPVAFLAQGILQPIWALLGDTPSRLLVPEFWPSLGSPLAVAIVGAYLLLRRPASGWGSLVRQPFFVLAVAGWALGFVVSRFWTDWGLPALCVWSAQEIDGRLDGWEATASARSRLRWTVALGTLLVLSTTHDAGQRWTRYVGHRYLDGHDPTTASWLPEPGGILYNDSMNTFFDTYYANPHGEWRYVLAFEPGMMPVEDERIYRGIQRRPSTETYRPWVEKLRPEDRLVLLLAGPEELDFPELEWKRFESGHWIGRLRAERRATRSGP